MAKRKPKTPPQDRESDLVLNATTKGLFERVRRIVRFGMHQEQCELVAALALWDTVVLLADGDAHGNPNAIPLMRRRYVRLASTVADLLLADQIAGSSATFKHRGDVWLIERSKIILTVATGLAALALQRYLGLDEPA